MVENLRRWSGNMLRNGQRAIMLGPRQMPLFIWWCCVDQRLAMWTMLFSPLLAIAGAIKLGFPFFLAYLVFIAFTRGLLSLVLSVYAHQVDLNYVWALYVNQLVNAAVKVYMIWRLSKQKWANRGNQAAGFAGAGIAPTLRNAMAVWLTTVSVAGLFVIVMVYTQLLTIPTAGYVAAVFF